MTETDIKFVVMICWHEFNNFVEIVAKKRE